MKRIFIVLLGFLFISCATTKTFDITDSSYSDEEDSITYIRTVEHVEATYEPNTKLIMFDVFCMPFVYAGLFCRETGRVVVYSVANIGCGYVAGMYPKDPDFGLWLPDIEKTQKELDELNKKFNETDFMKYRQYVRPLSKTTLDIQRLIEEVNIQYNTSRVISNTHFTLVFVDGIQDTVARVSKKSSLIGQKIGSVSAKVISQPTYWLGYLYGRASEK